MVEKRKLSVKLDNFKMKNESCVKENRKLENLKQVFSKLLYQLFILILNN